MKCEKLFFLYLIWTVFIQNLYIQWLLPVTWHVIVPLLIQKTEIRLPKSTSVGGQQQYQCWSLQCPYTRRFDCSLMLTSRNSSLTSGVQNSLETWSPHRQLSMVNSILTISLACLAADLWYSWKLWLCNIDDITVWRFGQLLSKWPILQHILPAIISCHTVCRFNRTSPD